MWGKIARWGTAEPYVYAEWKLRRVGLANRFLEESG
jgi:hypothetical protein